MKKLISFETLARYCFHRNDIKRINQVKYVCLNENEIKNYFRDAIRCNSKNCPIWKRLKDARNSN